MESCPSYDPLHAKMGIILIILLLAALRLSSGCQNVTEKDCPSPAGNSPCVCARLVNRTDTVVCCNINTSYKYNQGLACGEVEKYTTKHLHIFNYTLDTFNANSTKWRHLESLSVTGGKFRNLTGRIYGNLQCANFSTNSLFSIDNSTFTELSNLKTLDISHNNLTSLPDLPPLDYNNLTLDISKNQLDCKSMNLLFAMKWFKNIQFNHVNDTYCYRQHEFHWFDSYSIRSFPEMIKIKSVDEECPTGPNYQCQCSVDRINLMNGFHASGHQVKVNCSGLGLTELPKLPPDTSHLYISNNNISSLDKFTNDSSYASITFFVADNNNIDNIKCLEGSPFMYKFHILSLKDNSIKSIPTYLFSNVFDVFEARRVMLGGNRLNCDCNTAQNIKQWLKTYSTHITDYDEILCDKEDLGRVLDLDPNQVCIFQKDWTDYIYYIIALEIILLVLLFSKVSYDYWVFKTSGYLPWPASKMPKLPCDWVFET